VAFVALTLGRFSFIFRAVQSRGKPNGSQTGDNRDDHQQPINVADRIEERGLWVCGKTHSYSVVDILDQQGFWKAF